MAMDSGYRVFNGDWVRGMMVHVTHAVAAAHKLEAYSFVGNHEGLRYEVSADPDAKTAKLRIHPKFGASDLSFVDAVYDLDAARQLAEIINQAEKSEKWYEDNKELFVTPIKP